MNSNLQRLGGGFTQNTLAAIQSFLSAQGIVTQGNVWFVLPNTGSDTADGTSPQSAVKTLKQALSLATANQNDVVLLAAQSNTASNTTDYQNTGLVWNKDGVHLIGINAGGFLGQRSRVACQSTATAFSPLFTLSANGCLIQGIEFFMGAMSTNPTTASTCVLVSGSRNRLANCQISGIGDSTLDDAGSNSLTITGTENMVQGCYIGLDTTIRGTAAAEVVISGTAARTMFVDTQIRSWTSLTTFKAVSIATTVDRFVQFIRPVFAAAQNLPSSAVPTGALGLTTIAGQVEVFGPVGLIGYALLSTGGNTYVKVVTPASATTGQGVAQSAASS